MWVAALLLLTALAAAERPVDDSLIGWKGDTYDHDAVFGALEGALDAAPKAAAAGDPRPRWIETVSWKPRAFVFHNFLSQAECDHIIHTSAPSMKRSTVVGQKDQGVVDNIRTSYGTFVGRNHDPTVAAIEERLANWTHLPVVNQEDMQARVGGSEVG